MIELCGSQEYAGSPHLFSLPHRARAVAENLDTEDPHTWWRNGYGVGLAIKRSWVRFPVRPLSSYLGQLSLPSLWGR